MALSSILGYPRIGAQRELKKALENYWGERNTEVDLSEIGKKIRADNWSMMSSMGISEIPSNDFSFYDQVLDTAVMVGAIPPRYLPIFNKNKFDGYFAMARGTDGDGEKAITALEMTKWFNTNYHYIVPEINPDTEFKLDSTKIIGEYLEALSINVVTRPVILGPVSFLMLSKSLYESYSPLLKLNDLIQVYRELLGELKSKGVRWVQIDEPCICLDLTSKQEHLFSTTYDFLSASINRPKIMLVASYEAPHDIESYCQMPTEGLHLDLVSAPHLVSHISKIDEEKFISLGIIDGRNIWRIDLEKTYASIEEAVQNRNREKIIMSSSCTMMHVPMDIESEKLLPESIKATLSFAKQKIQEIALLTKAFNQGAHSIRVEMQQSRIAVESRNLLVRPSQKVRPDNKSSLDRRSPYKVRSKIQQKNFYIPVLPTTTIGSFPQTNEIRHIRSKYEKGELNHQDYENFIKQQITKVVRFQEKMGLDVLVHGEFERNDMVQYFAEKLNGFIFTKNGWVQSFGSRYVRPPIIFGDISRPGPISVEWIKYAQSLTTKPVKGMLTGPVTILKWSFPRDDQPIAETCRQIAFAIRQEVEDLQKAGIRMIQIDEPAFREGFPIKRSGLKTYLNWAVACFKIATSIADDETQIHTHMCYSDFDDILPSIAEMDADVISIEAARSGMGLLKAFKTFKYPNAIGPGIYDIHSPRIPDVSEYLGLLKNALQWIPADQLWVNPDCGLKTRSWNEIEKALADMVEAAKIVRSNLAVQ